MKLQVSDDVKVRLVEDEEPDAPRRGNVARVVVGGLLAVLIISNVFLLIKVTKLEKKVKKVEKAENFILHESDGDEYEDGTPDGTGVEIPSDIFGTPDKKYRSKRSPAGRNRPVCHLVGEASQPNDEFFSWKKGPSPLSSCLMSTKPNNGPVKEIYINRSGFYYVYAQVTFRTVGLRNNAIQVVRRVYERTNPEVEENLMTSVVRQQANSELTPADSVSVGGVLYLHQGQYVKVRDVRVTLTMSSYDERPTYTFFGVAFLRR